LDEDPFDGVHRRQPIAVVAPAVTATRSTGSHTTRERRSTHTFGLTVSRFDWKGQDRGVQLADVARRAEQAGFRDIWVMDHFRQIRGVGRPWEDLPEAYTALAYMAGATTSIRLGAMVTSVTHRPPIVLGKMVATLDVLSGGRANCGLGAGWDQAEHVAYGIEFPDLPVRFRLLEETLQMLPLLWGRGTPAFSGEHIRSPELICYPRPVQERIPILVGGGGERRTLRLVARYADACNVFGDPPRVGHKTEVLRAHCEEVGRDPAAVEVTHLTNALPAPDRASLRREVDRLRDRNTSAETYMARQGAGTVDDLVELFTAYSEAGADHSIVSMPTVWEEGSVETFADVIASFAHP
jgi:F420-dependent oxidoreductase-like protein